MICKAQDLSAEQKVLIENLVGRRLSRDEAVSIRVLVPPALSDERRREIEGELRRYFAEVDSNHTPTSSDQAEEIITEAMRSTRPRYRPHP